MAGSGQHYSSLPGVPSVTARVACSAIQPGSVRMLVDVLSWRREFRTAKKRERERETPLGVRAPPLDAEDKRVGGDASSQGCL